MINIETEINSANILEKLPEEQRASLAQKLYDEVQEDILSRDPWFKNNTEYLKMALQIKEQKTFPWPDSANVKYPLITIAALQFQARAYSGIVDAKSMVKGKVIGYDPSGEKAKKAERISKHMTYQLLDKIENWDDDMDRLLLILAICGTVFKKVYWSSRNEHEEIELVLPQDLIVNYWAKSLNTARRITHCYDLYHDEVLARQKEGIYLDVDVPEPTLKSRGIDADKLSQTKPGAITTENCPHKIYEIHTKLDLDEDGILEPYVVTLEADNKILLRIAPNYEIDTIKKNASGEIIEIRPCQYFVKYGFIPSPDGGFYDVGFGLLLGNLNETASTLINQLLDSGTMHATSGGFMTKSIKLKGGQVAFGPNEWKQISFTGDDIRKHIVPLPVREPSSVLFQLLSFIDQKGSQIISISEISTGKLPGQNTPAMTTMTAVEEGLKLFTSIYKRVYRSLKKELKLLFKVNKDRLQDEEYFSILDSDGSFQAAKVSAKDYADEDIDVIPVADPNAASDALRLTKASQLVELISIGAVNPAAAGQRILEAMDQPNPQELLPQPQPDPKVQQAQAKMQMDQQKHQQDMESSQMETQMKMALEQMKLKFSLMEKQMEMGYKQQQLKMQQVEALLDLQMKKIQGAQDMQVNAQKHAFDMEAARDKLNTQKESNKVKREGMKSGSRNSGSKQGKLG